MIERLFGQSSEKELLEWANGERRRLEESLAEERNEHDHLRRRIHSVLDAAGGLVKTVLDESEDYLAVIHAVNNVLLNPRNKNEKRKAVAIDRIRQQCKAAIERTRQFTRITRPRTAGCSTDGLPIGSGMPSTNRERCSSQ